MKVLHLSSYKILLHPAKNIQNIKENPSTYVPPNGEMYHYMPDQQFTGPRHLPVKANFYPLTKLERVLSFSRFIDLPAKVLMSSAAISYPVCSQPAIIEAIIWQHKE